VAAAAAAPSQVQSPCPTRRRRRIRRLLLLAAHRRGQAERAAGGGWRGRGGVLGRRGGGSGRGQAPFGVREREEGHLALGGCHLLARRAKVTSDVQQRHADVLEVHRFGGTAVAQQRLDVLQDGAVDVLHVVRVLDAQRLEGHREPTVALLDAL